MGSINIEIYEEQQILKIKSETLKLGSQYDNEAQTLVFLRPETYAGDDLILYFSNTTTSFEPCNIGSENTFAVSSFLTGTSMLWLQIAFSRDGGILAHSDTLAFNLRPSVTAFPPAAPSIPSALNQLKAAAFTAVCQENDTLLFQNMDGATVSSVTVSGAGASRAYVDEKAAETLTAAKTYTDNHGGGNGGVSQAYVDDKDALTLQQAKAYTDATGGNLPGGAYANQSIVTDENGAPEWRNLSLTDITPDSYPITAWHVNHANYTIEITGGRSFNYYSKYQLNGARIAIDIADLDSPIYFDFDIAFDQDAGNIWFGCSNLTAPLIAYVNSGHNTITVSRSKLIEIRATGAAEATFYIGGAAEGINAAVTNMTVAARAPFLGTLENTLNTLSVAAGNLLGKTIMLFGDSIIHSAEWQKNLKKMALPDQIINKAVPSATLTVKPGQTSPTVKAQIDAVVAASDTFAQPDVILIAAGVNDNTLDVEAAFPAENLESWFTTDGRAPVTLDALDLFYAPAAMRYFQEKLLSVFPDARIIFCSPIQNSGALRREPEMLMRRNGIEAAARRLSAGFIDLYQNSGIYGVVEAQGLKHTSDGTHLSDKGADRYARAMLAGIRAAGI
jgi:lysophospholipase L1-like esterase